MWRRKVVYAVIIVLAIVSVIVFFRSPKIKESSLESDKAFLRETTKKAIAHHLTLDSTEPLNLDVALEGPTEMTLDVSVTNHETEDKPSQMDANSSELITISVEAASVPAPEQNESKASKGPQYKIIHHEPEYKTVHHDAVMIQHKAVYKTVHHDAEGHYEDVVISPAWDEEARKEKTEQHVFCNESSCHMDFTSAGYSNDQIWDHIEAHALKGEASGHHTENIKTVVTETIHHKAQTQRVWITDKEAWDEKVLVKDAWEEIIPAYDEWVLVKEAWDEAVPE